MADARTDTEAGPSAIEALHHVQLGMPAGREDEARVFFGKVLGLDEVSKPSHLTARGGVWLRLGREAGGLEIHLGVEADFRPAERHTRPCWSAAWINCGRVWKLGASPPARTCRCPAFAASSPTTRSATVWSFSSRAARDCPTVNRRAHNGG